MKDHMPTPPIVLVSTAAATRIQAWGESGPCEAAPPIPAFSDMFTTRRILGGKLR
jgi:hypothetical protein